MTDEEILQAAAVRLIYDPATGSFTWRWRTDTNVQTNAQFAGKPAGSLSTEGYLRLRFGKREITAQRVAWLMTYGLPLPREIDHINGNKTDNRITNLRAATTAQNQYNRGPAKNNSTGFKGVSPIKNGRFAAQIKANKKWMYLGAFKTPEEASAAYNEAARKYHGQFAFNASHG